MMKFKPNQTRTYDGEGFKKRAACLCFKNDREDEVLLVSSSRHPDQWIVPGGGMEPEEEPGGAAVREVYEEVSSCLFRAQLEQTTTVKAVNIYLRITIWRRKRKWFKIDEAIRVLQCHKPVHAEYLRKLTPHCGPTNGNTQEPANTVDNAPLHQTASHDCGLPRLHR
uniref:diphosphoinositol-polyphosphate diphosphatase n=1 Tax=Sinocyclocheilus grahami TaxID=75366 RepID=A0A672QK29_SINGR